jgi:hypothetical protein
MPGPEPHEPQFPPPPLDEYGDSAPLTSTVAEQAPTHAAPDTSPPNSPDAGEIVSW